MLLTYLFWGAFGMAVGYAIYTITVDVLSNSNIRNIICTAMEGHTSKKRMKALIREITDEGNSKKVKIDVLDELDGTKACEVEITGKEIIGLCKGSLIDEIVC